MEKWKEGFYVHEQSKVKDRGPSEEDSDEVVGEHFAKNKKQVPLPERESLKHA